MKHPFFRINTQVLIVSLMACNQSFGSDIFGAGSVAADDVKVSVDAATAQAAGSPKESSKGVPNAFGKITVAGKRPTSLPSHIPTVIDGVTREELERTINAADSEDALKYLPSLTVRKRYIGDFDHAVLASRASGTGNSARSLVYADGILLSNLLGNGASFTPRWGLVAPQEIERVEVLYGPFSAAYSGNSVGAVVDYITRMPSKFEAHAQMNAFTQRFALYNTDGRFSGKQIGGNLGSRSGAFSWWFNLSRLDNAGQPLVFTTKLLSQGAASAAGTPVTGTVPGQNPRNQDWLLLGTTNQFDTVQDHAKLKLAYDVGEDLRVSYTLGVWQNDAERDARSYLRDSAGNSVWSGDINVDGRRYTLAPTDFSVTKADLTHVIHGLSIKRTAAEGLGWELAASHYDYQRDESRSPLVAVPQARAVVSRGRLTDQHGTGWTTLAAKGVYKGEFAGARAHWIDFGVQYDRYRLRTLVSDTDDWVNGSAGARVSAFQGDTAHSSFYAQDTVRWSEQLRTTLGLRAERWQARNGAIANATSQLTFGERRETHWSPKLAIAYQLTPTWAVKSSLGRAVRFPTVSELYQGSISTNVIVNNDPNLKPERSWTGELSSEYELGTMQLRATAFAERSRDALYSQTNLLVTPNVTNIQNIQAINTTGIELSARANDLMLRGLSVIGSLTFARSIIDKNDPFPASVGKWQPRVPRWRANFVTTYAPSERLSLTLGMRYSGKQFGSLDNADTNPNAYTGVSSFFVADMRARFKLATQWTAAIGVDNLNNRTYWAFHPYPQRTVQAEINFEY